MTGEYGHWPPSAKGPPPARSRPREAVIGAKRIDRSVRIASCIPAPGGGNDMTAAIFRAIALAISLLVLGAGMVRAQTPVAPPPGMSQEQFDSLVDAISKSVVDKLKAEGIPAPAPPKSGKGAPPPKPEIRITTPRQGPGEFAIFLQRAAKVVLAFPVLGHELDAIAGDL